MREWSRRDILTAFLGLPAASLAVAGCSNKTPPLPAGRILGASSDIGHRLREWTHITPAPSNWTRTGVVIVGGGVAGFSAARRLLAAGVNDFVLLELERDSGGLSRWGVSDVVAYPWAAHYLPVPMKENRALIELLDEMGVLAGRDALDEPIVKESFLCHEPEERLFTDGRWREGLLDRSNTAAEEQTQFQAFVRLIDDWVAWRDDAGRRAFAIPLADCSEDPEVTQLDQITMGRWMDQHGLISPTLRWYVDYCCRDDYGMRLEQTSAWAGLFYFASRIRRPGDESQSLITWPEGNGKLIAHMHGAVTRRAKVRLGLAVTEINPRPADGGGLDVIAVEHDAKTAHGFHASSVIFAAPQFLRPFLIRDAGGAPSCIDQFNYGSWAVANLHLTARPVERHAPLAWDNVLQDSPSLGYVVATHQTGAKDGPTVFTYYYPLCDDDPAHSRARLLQTTWESWADIAISDLERAHPDIRPLIERLDVMRWGHAMIQARPGFLWGQARRDAANPEGRIFFANSDLSGLPLFEEAFYHGNRAAEEALAELGVPFESVL